MTAAAAQLFQAARDLAPAIIAARGEIESGRKLPCTLVDALASAGMFALQTPGEYGGANLTLRDFMSVIEEIGRADGSTGWVVSVLNGGAYAGYVEKPVADALFSGSPGTRFGASFNAGQGRAVIVPGGFRVSGKWRFVSGCDHADWLVFGCLVVDPGVPSDEMRTRPPVFRRVIMRASDATILDTWHVSGMRGTGSHDLEAHDIFVPAEFGYDPAASPTRDDTFFRYPAGSMLGLGFSSVGLGIARQAIDTLTELAGGKRPVGSRGLLRERATVQIDLARAEAMLGSARGYLHQVVGETWANTEAGRDISLRERATVRGAVVHAAETAAKVVDLMYNAGGATSIFETSVLERCFRDIHALTQQITMSPENFATVGRVYLGMEPDAYLL